MPAPFNQVWRPLDRALAMAQVGSLEAIVLCVARELSYSRAIQNGKLPDPLPFRLNLSRIARDWGVDRKSLRLARNRLIRDRMLIETPDGLRINKRFNEWTGAHKLTKRQVATARAAATIDAIDTYGTTEGTEDDQRPEPTPATLRLASGSDWSGLEGTILPPSP